MARKERVRRRYKRVFFVIYMLIIVVGIAVLSINTLFTTGRDKHTYQLSVELFFTSSCECCRRYQEYLQENGFNVIVKEVSVDELVALKKKLRIPAELWSCHTARINEYFVEGHIPVIAIEKLIAGQPAINGIALAGMPAGAPGMGGEKSEQLVIYSVVSGNVDVFMRF